MRRVRCRRDRSHLSEQRGHAKHPCCTVVPNTEAGPHFQLLRVTCCVSRGPQRNRSNGIYICSQTEIWFKDLAHASVGTSKSEICRAGWQAGSPGRISDTVFRRNPFLLRKRQSLLLMFSCSIPWMSTTTWRVTASPNVTSV